MKTKTIILILGFAGFTVLADNWVVSPILPAISAYFDEDISTAGLLITAYMIPFGLFQLVFGPLADRFGKRQVINFAMLFFSISAVLCSFAGSTTQLLIFRALTGIFAASVVPVSLALIGDLVPLSQRQSAIGSFMGISFLGQSFSMTIGGTVAYFLNWRGVFAIYALLAVISTFMLFTTGRQIPSAKNPNSKLLAPYVKLLSSSISIRTYLVILFEGIFIIGTFSYLGAYISKAYQFNYLYIGLIMTAFGLAAITGGRLSGRMAAKWGRKTMLTLGLLLAAAADILFHTVGGVLPTLVLGVTLLGFGFTLAHSTLITMATEFAAQSRGAAMSLVAFCLMGGGGIGTAIGGRIIQNNGFSVIFELHAVGLAILAVTALLIVQTGITTDIISESK
ncbi:MAG: Inner membrane transport protein YnfM [Pelotomaculum sp. PtaB.Bin104]|nr:MAG: Inner membrane transport protein YnfM [Pelotomaculum sp. PtaB.Bin104]